NRKQFIGIHEDFGQNQALRIAFQQGRELGGGYFHRSKTKLHLLKIKMPLPAKLLSKLRSEPNQTDRMKH
ncbi:MAG: hypothetical protein ACKOUD_05620, partial [Rhodoluna sp.]